MHNVHNTHSLWRHKCHNPTRIRVRPPHPKLQTNCKRKWEYGKGGRGGISNLKTHSCASRNQRQL